MKLAPSVQEGKGRGPQWVWGEDGRPRNRNKKELAGFIMTSPRLDN